MLCSFNIDAYSSILYPLFQGFDDIYIFFYSVHILQVTITYGGRGIQCLQNAYHTFLHFRRISESESE